MGGPVGSSDGADASAAPTLYRSKVREQHLIFPVMESMRKKLTKCHQLRAAELAPEDGELQTDAVATHRLEDFP